MLSGRWAGDLVGERRGPKKAGQKKGSGVGQGQTEEGEELAMRAPGMRGSCETVNQMGGRWRRGKKRL